MTRFREQTLPCCGKKVDGCTVIDPANRKDHGSEQIAPKQGDFTICIYCGAWLRFTDDEGTQRKFDAEDILDVTDEQREMMRKATALVHQTQADKTALPPGRPFIRVRRPRR